MSAVPSETLPVSGDVALRFNANNAREKPLTAALNLLFERATMEGAADIHLESREDHSIVARLRNRDGDLVQAHEFSEDEANLVFNKIRNRANLSTSDTRGAQDSRIAQEAGGRTLSVRVSVVKTLHGYSCVMRLLDPNNSGRPIESLLMPERVEKAFRAVISSPEGLILTVGPTGSGKTSTLYTAINLLNDPSIKICTAEDPVEYVLPGIQQVEVGANRGISFAEALRSFLRQDPDIILVGEVRDGETISTALAAGQTGHLVLSTLHANDSIEAMERMIELGAKPQTLRSALRAVIAQRLVRTVCEHCKVEREIVDAEALDILQRAEMQTRVEMVGAGCDHCGGKGYSGRRAIYEMLLMDKPARLAVSRTDIEALRQAAHHQRQFRTLLRSGLELVEQGVTNMKEIRRVVVEL